MKKIIAIFVVSCLCACGPSKDSLRSVLSDTTTPTQQPGMNVEGVVINGCMYMHDSCMYMHDKNCPNH